MDRAPRLGGSIEAGGSSEGGEDVLKKEDGAHQKAEAIPFKTTLTAKAVVAE